jgi:hypothetical protein
MIASYYYCYHCYQHHHHIIILFTIGQLDALNGLKPFASISRLVIKLSVQKITIPHLDLVLELPP